MNAHDTGFVYIRDLGNYLDHKVNVLGVVLEFSLPRKSRGTDFVSTLKLIDESQQSPEFSVNIFTKTIDHLPHVRSYGDLILLKNVTIKTYEGQVSGVFYKDSSSFALFDGTPSTEAVLYQSSPRFLLLDFEKDFISHLSQLFDGVQFSSGSSEYLLKLKNIPEKTCFDLVCKVLHISYDAHKDVWMLFVWDGTDVPPLNLHGKLEDEKQNPLPLQIESVPLDHNILRQFQPIGTVLRIMADKTHENLDKHFRAVGKWVRLLDVTGQISSGIWHGFLKPSARVRFLSDDNNVVLDLHRDYNERIFENNGHLPQWSKSSHFLTVIDLEDITFVTLMDVITNAKLNASFCCIVRVVASYPSEADDFRSPYCPSATKMRLTLEDPTARIHAFLRGDEWMKFFDGSPIDVFTTKLNMLLGMPERQYGSNDGEFSRSPPWIQCCIEVKRSANGRRKRYYICSTRIVTQ
ncbi:protection of telomeres protein 1b-like isoform X1 [Pistacia vera]|uniref:protection of telomeres protein 1b-like isoform X1 n=2 Tax=Pistacia vera TaxID=55513 RepID=UPI001262E913|nr:protection of telomeres protein 1b-like isoform X1 [Pistacia vera]